MTVVAEPKSGDFGYTEPKSGDFGYTELRQQLIGR